MVLKVVTVDESEMEALCMRMSEFVRSTGGSVVIGVRQGGAVLSRIVQGQLQDAISPVLYYEVEAGRRSKQLKSSGIVSVILNRLPESMLDVLRKLESTYLAQQMRIGVKQIRKVDVASNLDSVFRKLADATVVVIDDAVDSGYTLRGVIENLQEINPNLTYVTCVLTVTQKRPVIEPDFAVYKDVLLRMPWAVDAGK